MTWYYVVYSDYPIDTSQPLNRRKPRYVSSRHRSVEKATKALEGKLADPYWRGYHWIVTTELW